MAAAHLAWLWFWVISPFTLLMCCIFRYNALSSVYCLLLVTFPYSPKMKLQFMASWLRYTRTVVAIAFAFVCAQISFQVVLGTGGGEYGTLLAEKRCSDLELTMSYVGLHRMDGMDSFNVFRLVAPEAFVLIVGVITYVLSKKARVALKNEADNKKDLNKELEGTALKRKIAFETMKNYVILTFSVFLMAVAGIILPSVLSSFYLTGFFMMCLLWGYNVNLLTPAVTVLRALISAVSALHLLFFHMYQIKYFQDQQNLKPDDVFPRIMGLRKIVEQPCSSRFALKTAPDATNTNAITSWVFILILHWSLAIGVRVFFRDYLVFLTKYGYSPKTIPLREFQEVQPASKEEEESAMLENEPTANGDDPPPGLTEKQQLKRKKRLEKEKKAAADERKRQKAEEGRIIRFYKLFQTAKSYSLYPAALIVMVVWGILFISWNTFALMMLSFFLWWAPDSCLWTLRLSPIFATYGMGMVIFEYIYAFDLTEKELPTDVPVEGFDVHMSEFGIERGKTKFEHLFVKIFFVFVFVVVMSQRQAVYRKRKAKKGEKTEIKDGTDSKLYQLTIKCWMFVVTAAHMFMAFSGVPSAIKIFYMLLLFVYIHTFVTMWTVWKAMLTFYLVIVELFTILALCAVYIFQFPSIPPQIKDATGLNDLQLADLGLINVIDSRLELAVLLYPHTLFLLCVTFQLHYLNKDFLRKIKDPTPEEIMEAVKTKAARGHRGHHHKGVVGKVKDFYDDFHHNFPKRIIYVHRALLFHLEKVVIIFVMLAAIGTANANRGILLVLWICCLPYKRTHWFLGTFTCLYISISLLINMFMQLSFVYNLAFLEDFNVKCTTEGYSGKKSGVLNQLKWLGFQRLDPDYWFLYHVQGLISIVVMIMLERAVGRREAWLNLLNNSPSYVVTSIFPIINWRHADINLTTATKYYINFFFYNFGLEICYIATLLTIWVTQDLFSVFYGIMFWISFGMRKKTVLLRRYFHFQIMALTLMYIWIYFSSIGMPPILCPHINYPWVKLGANEEQHNRLMTWLNLPEFTFKKSKKGPNSRSLHMFEFFQIFFLVMQQNSWKMKHLIKDYGGDNAVLTGSRLDEITVATNPTENFVIIRHKNSLHKIKIFIFEYFSWITLMVVFWTGTTQISLYCLGYLVGFFYMIFKKQKVIMGSVRILIRTWYLMILYSTFVIFAKNVMQIVPCVFKEKVSNEPGCVVVELLIMFCSYGNRYYYSPDSPDCGFSKTSSGLGWDLVCFVFLMVQLRICSSYEFLHVREDMISAFSISHLGYEMYNELLDNDSRQRISEETACIEEIKLTMQKLKERNANITLAYKPGHYDVIRGDNSMMFQDLIEQQTRSESTPLAPEPEAKPQVVRFSSFSSTDPTTVGTDSNKEHLRRLLALRAAEIESGEAPTEDPDLVTSSSESSPEPEEPSKVKVIATKIYHIIKSIIESILSTLAQFSKWVALKLNLWCYKYRNILRKLEIKKAQISREKAMGGPDAEERERLMLADVENASDSQPDPSKGPLPHGYEEIEGFDQRKHPFVQLINALWYFYIIKGDLICYLLICINLAITASLLSMVLPLAVFFWGSFAVPRPTKKFWIFLTLYLEFVIIIRFIFQFNFFPWNDHSNQDIAYQRETNPYWFPIFIGIDKWEYWNIMDMLQLFTAVFHVNVIKQMGLWEVRGFSDNAIEEVLRKTMCDQPSEQQMLHEADETSGIQGIQRNPFTQLVREHNDLPLIGRIVLKMKLTSSLTKREGITPSFSQRAIHTLFAPVMFYWEVLHQRVTLVTDMYVWMFWLDMINSILVVLFYGKFGPYASVNENVMHRLTTNKVPDQFLVNLLFQFIMVFVDRALYLKKNVGGRLYFHLVLMVVVHIWLFFFLPWYSKASLFYNPVAMIWYIIKCVYFLMSAYQIRVGYPLIVNISFMTKFHSMKGLIAYKIYCKLPFMPELTQIMNWMFTKTTLDLNHWMTLWTIDCSIFEINCWRTMARKAPVPRGRVFPQKNKYILGGIFVGISILAVWFPLLFFNIVFKVFSYPNNPTGMEIDVSMDTFEHLLTAVTDNASIVEYTSERYNEVADQFSDSAEARQYLSMFTYNQMTDIHLITESQSIWAISPPQKELLVERLAQADSTPVAIAMPLQIFIRWSVKRSNPNIGGVQFAQGEATTFLNPTNMLEMMDIIQAALIGKGTLDPTGTIKTFGDKHHSVKIDDMLPTYLHITLDDAAKVPVELGDTAKELRPLLLSLKGKYHGAGSPDKGDNYHMWWELGGKKGENVVICFSDPVTLKIFDIFVQYGVLGLYSVFVLMIGNIFKGLYAGLFRRIQLGQLHQVDKLHQLLNDIRLVRQLGEMNLEEDLFGKLVYIYKSPETMIKFTKRM